MKILAIETATDACSVALHIDAVCWGKFQLAPRKQASLILPMIDALLIDASLRIGQLDLLAFGQGPGSFTGVRIAASVIQGLALAAELPVVGISTLHALAQGAYRELGVGATLVALDARREEVYWGVYYLDEKSNKMVKHIDDCVISPAQIKCPNKYPNKQQAWVGIGNGWQIYEPELLSQLGTHLKKVYPKQYPNAQDIATLAAFEFKAGRVLTAEQALPVYLRDQVTQPSQPKLTKSQLQR